MGRLTEDMVHLRSNIDSMRANIDSNRESRLVQQNTRVSGVKTLIAGFAETRASAAAKDARVRMTFVTANANDISRLLNDFRHTRQMTGQQARETRAVFMSRISKDTVGLLTGFNADRKSMAERSAKNRTDFIAAMTNSVATFIKDATQDRVGAHAAFFDVATSKKKNDIPRIAIQLINELLVENNESESDWSEGQSNEQPEQVLSFSLPEDLAKLETFSEPETKTETRKSRRRHHEHIEDK
jgi:hypothetical protein